MVFPAILRALLDLRVKNLGEDMLVSVATAIADIVDGSNVKRIISFLKLMTPV